MIRAITFAFAALWLGGSARATITCAVLPPSAYDPDTSVTNANLGISPAYMVEGFEDWNGSRAWFAATDPNGVELQTRCGDNPADEKWDGDCALLNRNTYDEAELDVLFTLEPGVTRFGVGLGHLNAATALWVNGTLIHSDIRALPNFQTGDFIRNGYLWIEASDGMTIQTVLFDGPTGFDAIYFDHAAWLACLSGPTHYWDFETGVDDHVGGQIGTNNGAQSCAARFRGEAGIGYVFDGNASVTTDLAPQLGNTDSMSLSVWAKLSSAGAFVTQTMFGLEQSESSEIRLRHNLDGGTYATFRDDSGNQAVAIAGTSNLADDRWHHYAAVRDASTGHVLLYIDGELAATAADSGGPINIASARTLDIGSNNHSVYGHIDPLVGMIDEFRIYDRVLSEQEVRALAGLPPIRCDGDIDLDGDVDVLDFGLLAPNFGTICE